jgi:hypothetical protein
MGFAPTDNETMIHFSSPGANTEQIGCPKRAKRAKLAGEMTKSASSRVEFAFFKN